MLLRSYPPEVGTSPRRYQHLPGRQLWCCVTLIEKKMIIDFIFLQPVLVAFCPFTVLLQERPGLHHLYIFLLGSFIKPLFHLLFSRLNKPWSLSFHLCIQCSPSNLQSPLVSYFDASVSFLYCGGQNRMWPNDIFCIRVSVIFIARYIHMTLYQ